MDQTDRRLKEQPAAGAALMVSEKRLEEFKKIYLKKHGIELDDATARRAASNLLHIVAITRRPLPGKKLSPSQQHDL